jgi:serine/threonine protein kinase
MGNLYQPFAQQIFQMHFLPSNAAIACDKNLLSRYLESTLAAGEQVALENHLSGCEQCRAAMESLAADVDFWKAATDALEAPPSSALRPLTDLSLSALAPWGSDLDTFPVDSLASGAQTESTLNQTQMLQRWLDPTSRGDSLGRIGKYEVLGVVGQGGMGLVLKAIDTELDRMVAIKTLAHHVTSRTDARLRLAREARAAAALRHPHIVSVFGLETWRDVPLIVMPLVEDGTLQQYAATQRLTTEQVLATGLQIAEALAALHAAGIVHRDLKPSNILLQDGLDHVLISDFGLARFDGDLAITHSDALAGTPFFMSPEQALGRPIDVRSDLFSFGSVLYWLCTGQYPFRGSSNYETLSKLVHSQASADELSRLKVPSYLQRLIYRLLAKDPGERWSSAEKVVELLRACLAHHRSSTEPLPVELTPSPAGWSSRRWPLRLSVPLLGLSVLCIWMSQYLSFTVPPHRFEANQGTEISVQPNTLGENPDKSDETSLRYGALDELDRLAMLANFKRGERVHYWLRRLAYLPVEEIPPEAIPLVQRLAENPDLATQELSQVILNKNPFQEIIILEAAIRESPTPVSSSQTENPFQEISPDE